MTDMLDIVRQRYTTKHSDETKRISDEDFAKLAEVLRLSPSSVNSQPWHWFVADTDEAKAKILPAILDFNRERVTKASHVVVFAVHEDLTDDYLKALLAQEVADGRFKKEDIVPGVDAGRRHFVGLHQVSPEEIISWQSRQAYIAMGFLLYAAAGMGIDSTCLEGIEADKLDEILGLREKGLRTIAAVSLGYRAADDSNASRPKSRWPLDKVLTRI